MSDAVDISQFAPPAAENDISQFAPPPGAFEEPSWAPRSGAGKTAFDAASDVVRPVLRGAAQVYGFLGPDELTFLWNQIPGSTKAQIPSDYWQQQIDKFTAKPTGKAARGIEDVSSAVAGGMLGAGTAGLLDQGGNLAVRSLRSFLGGNESHPNYSPEQVLKYRNAKQVADAGYKLPPEWIGGRIARSVQDLMSKARVTRSFAAANEQVTDNLAKRALGLNDMNLLDERTLDGLREDSYKAYDALRGIGRVRTDGDYLTAIKDAGDRFLGIQGEGAEPLAGSQLKELRDMYGGKLPKSLRLSDESQLSQIAKKVQAEKAPYLAGRFTSAWALDQIKVLRSAARANLAKYDPVDNAVGATQREIAQALEDQLSRAAQAKAADDPGLRTVVGNFLKAREALAKIRVVSDAMGPNGKVDARAIGMIEKKNPGYLTGPLHTIAVAANNFPDAVALSQKGTEGGWSRVDFLFGGTGFALHSPTVLALGASRPAITAGLKSGAVQRSMLKGLKRASEGARSTPAAVDTAKGISRGAAMQAVDEQLQ